MTFVFRHWIGVPRINSVSLECVCHCFKNKPKGLHPTMILSLLPLLWWHVGISSDFC
jgi:hypothetical protein